MSEEESALFGVLRFLIDEDQAEDAARRLLTICGSLSGLLEWDTKELCRMLGLPESVINYLALMPLLARETALNELGSHPRINTRDEAVRYLTRLYIGCACERSYVLCLNRQRNLIECARIAEGTTNETHLYIRTVLECVVRTHAAAVVLSHNHPGHTAAPSMEDVTATRRIIEALSAVHVSMLDHIIIAGKTDVSLRGEYAHLLPEFESLSGDNEWFAP